MAKGELKKKLYKKSLESLTHVYGLAKKYKL